MNKPIVFIPLSFLVIFAIVYISISVPTFNLMLNFTHLLALSFLMTIGTGVFMYMRYKNQFDGENLYLLTGSSVLFSFVVWLALIAFIDQRYATKQIA